MAKNKYYAVATGRKPGIYDKWYGQGGAEEQVNGYPGAKYRGFPTLRDAEIWLEGNLSITNSEENSKIIIPPDKSTSQSEDTIKVIIYTDGGCIGNPGPGGYGIVIQDKGKRREISGGYRLTTNNRMELMACIVALSSLDDKSAGILYSDSQYIVNGINKGWAFKWRSNDWNRNKREKAENSDLWEELLKVYEENEIEFRWIRGHIGIKENERCDQLSMEAAARKDLQADNVYEASRTDLRA